MNQFFYDEGNRLSCANMGMKNPSPACQAQNQTMFIYDDTGVRKAKIPAQPVVYLNQSFSDFGGSQYNHLFIGFIGSERRSLAALSGAVPPDPGRTAPSMWPDVICGRHRPVVLCAHVQWAP
jgi:hypothetical protein